MSKHRRSGSIDAHRQLPVGRLEGGEPGLGFATRLAGQVVGEILDMDLHARRKRPQELARDAPLHDGHESPVLDYRENDLGAVESFLVVFLARHGQLAWWFAVNDRP